MMRGVTGLAILFALAVAFAVAGQLDTGHVLIVYEPYRIDISLNFFVVASLLVLLLLYMLMRIAHGLSALPLGFKGYRTRSKEAGAQAALQDALNHAFSGHFEEVEKAARRAALSANNRDAASLIAAHAAHFRQDVVEREVWLARELPPKWQDAKSVHTAFLYAEANKAQAALDALANATPSTLRSSHAQRIALRAHRQLKHWPEVLRCIALLERHDGIKPLLARHLRVQAVEQLLEAHRDTAPTLLTCWNGLSAIERSAPASVECVIRLLLKLGDTRSAQHLIESALETKWNSKLLRFYPACAAEHTHALIERAELWRAKHSHDIELLSALGRLCVQQKLWGKAQAFFEEGLAIAHTDKRLLCNLHGQLAHLHEALGQHTLAQRHYRECTECALVE